MDERDYKAMNSENNSLGNLSEIAVGFYLWMNENGFDHNIKQRVEGKFIEYYRTQLLKLNKSDVISSVCICGYPNESAGYNTNWKMVCSSCGKPKQTDL